MKKNKKIKLLVKSCVNDVFASGKLDQRKALKYLNLFKKAPKLEAIAFLEEYKKQVKRKLEETTLVIESATELGKIELNEIRRKFEKQFVVNQLQFTSNRLLLGGIKVRVGDYIFDDSVNTKIAEVKEVIVQ